MSTRVQFRRGTTDQHEAFAGANAEVTVDTNKHTLVVHDGETPGGFPLMPTQTFDPNSVGADAFDAANQIGFTTSDIGSKAIPTPVQSFTTSGYAAPGDGGGALWKRIADPGTVEAWHRQSADGAYWEIAVGTLHPEHIGMSVDAADNSAALLTALAATNALGIRLNGRNRTYKIGPTVLPTGHNYRIDDIVFDLSAIGQMPVIGLDIAGTKPSPIANLTVDAAAWATSIEVDDSSGLAADQWVYILSTVGGWDAEDTQDPIGNHGCEMIRIESVVGTTVNFWSALKGSYDATSGATVAVIDESTSVDFRRVGLIGAGIGAKQWGYRARYCFNNEYEDCWARDLEYRAYGEEVCFLTLGRGTWRVWGASINEEGYGVLQSGCHNCDYGNVWGYRLRHTIVNGAAGGSDSYAIHRDIQWGDVFAVECLGSPIDAHPGGDPITVGNVTAYAALDADTSSPVAIIECAGATIGSIRGFGFRSNGFTFQSRGWGDWKKLPTVRIGYLEVSGCVFSSIFVENLTGPLQQKCSVQVDHLVGHNPRGIFLSCQQGDAAVHIGGGRLVTESYHSIRVLSTALGRGEVSARNLDIVNVDGVTFNAVQVEGDAYHTANGTSGGKVHLDNCTITMSTGTGTRGIRADDGDVTLNDCQTPAGWTEAKIGTGTIKRATYA